MSYQSQERTRLVECARRTWEVEGHVLPYEVAVETLHESVRETALAYFNRHRIKWWTSRWESGATPLWRASCASVWKRPAREARK